MKIPLICNNRTHMGNGDKLASILFIVSFLLRDAATKEMIAPPPPTLDTCDARGITIANEIHTRPFVVPTTSGEGLTAEDNPRTIETKPGQEMVARTLPQNVPCG